MGFERVENGECVGECREVFMRLMLPEGYPESVTSDYLEYSVWRSVQGVAAQVSSVLATQVSEFIVFRFLSYWYYSFLLAMIIAFLSSGLCVRV